MSEAIGGILFIPAVFLWATYIILGEFLLPVYQKRILLVAAYVIVLGSLAATYALIDLEYGGVVVLFGGTVAGLFISLPALLLAKLLGRVQTLEKRMNQLAAAPNQRPAPDSQRASAPSAGEA
jgi:hypothetical protein